MERTGLSGKELYVLEHIREDNPWRFNEFAENYHIKPSTLTGIVERLEKKGLLKRERDEKDRKAVYLYCTSEGKRIVKDHIEEDQLFFNSMLATLDTSERAQFIDLVKRITSSEKSQQ